MSFTFDYGVISYKHRFSIKRSLDDYEEIKLNKCISLSVHFKYYTMACDELIPEVCIIYRDDNNSSHSLLLNLHDFNIKIHYLGDMKICL